MQWEYLVDSYITGGPLNAGAMDPTLATEKLNQFGAKGWELVASYPTANNNGGTKLLVFVYKRAKEDAMTSGKYEPATIIRKN